MGREHGAPRADRNSAVAVSPRRQPAPATKSDGMAAPQLFYAVSASPLGFMLIVATGKGLCAVRFDENREALIEGLRVDFSGAALEEDAERAEPYVGPLLRYLAGDRQVKLGELPLDLKATDFQWKVWNALQAVPPGKTISYAQLAEMTGDKKAVRAVAHANATNPVAVVIPCHRVIGSDGSLTGYRWGLERKRQLLEMERVGRKPEGRLF